MDDKHNYLLVVDGADKQLYGAYTFLELHEKDREERKRKPFATRYILDDRLRDFEIVLEAFKVKVESAIK